MVSREQLKQDGLRAYEFGRVRAAVRAAWFLVPAAVLCALETGAGEACACIGVLLLGAAVFLRWRSRQGGDSVRYGLVAGTVPLIAGLVVARIAPAFAGAPLVSASAAVCLGVGVPSGAWLGFQLARGASAPSTWLAAGAVAALAASLGCVGLGVAGIAGAVAGLVVGAAAAAVVVARTAQ